MVGLLVLTALSSPVGAGGPDKACAREVRDAGDWGKSLNPGKAEFVSGTEGDDVIDLIAPGVAFCGLGGNDVVIINNGWFYGGEGMDTVTVNNGMFDGGSETDVAMTNNGVFNGRQSRDIVHVNNGWFNGGPGADLVQDQNNGGCVDVEEGC